MKIQAIVLPLAALLLLTAPSCKKDSNLNATPVAANNNAVDNLLSDTALICYLPFNNNFNDRSGHENNATLKGNGTLTFVPNRFGEADKAVSFGASQSWLEIPPAEFYGLTKATICMDFYATSAARQVICSKMSYNSQNYYQSFVMVTDQHCEFDIKKEGFCTTPRWNPTIFSNTNYVLNQWNHLAVTFNDDGQRMYLNGVLVGGGKKTSSPICGDEPIRLGIWWQGDPTYFTGSLDQVMIFKRVLTAKEIMQVSSR